MSQASPAALAGCSLDRFFRPRSVAVIGATERPGSVGRALMENLSGFPGRLVPVNSTRATVLGHRAVPRLGSLDDPVDLAVVATPAATVHEVIAECGRAGVSHAIVISAGFKETGAAGAALEQRVLAEARGGGVRLLGPNCLGLISPHAGLNASFAATAARPGRVAFVSQSGALCTAILDWSLRETVGFSAFVSVGSMLDVGWGDLIDWLGRDPATESIVIYMESVGDARAFLAAARAVAWRKPIIVIKVGRTKAAARAAASHTGAMTGSDAVLDAAFRRVGVLRVASISEVFDMAEVLAKQPRPAGPRLAIVTNAGGPGALATDALVCNGGEPAVLTAPTFEQLNRLLPDHWSHGNPVDILGDATAERFAEATRIVSDDPDANGTLVILTPQAMTDATATAAALARIQPSMTKPLLASWMGGPAVEDARRLLNQAGIPTYDYPDSAARTFALMWEHGEALRALGEPVPPPPWAMEPNPDVEEAVKIVNSPRGTGAHFLSKPECNRILSAHRIPTLESHLATTEAAAVEWAARLGGAVVLKLHSTTITHKTDVGGVKLDLVGEAAVRRAWNEIRSAVSPDDFLGVTVEPMIPADGGLELIVGSSTDPQFGPVLLFGAGGQLVEVFRDRALGLPPLTRLLARQLISRTRIATALAGVRGRAPVDTDALEDLLVRFSHLVLEHPRIREIEVNPLRASSTGLIALDVRIVLQGSEVPDNALPRAVLGDPPPAAARALS